MLTALLQHSLWVLRGCEHAASCASALHVCTRAFHGYARVCMCSQASADVKSPNGTPRHGRPWQAPSQDAWPTTPASVPYWSDVSATAASQRSSPGPLIGTAKGVLDVTEGNDQVRIATDTHTHTTAQKHARTQTHIPRQTDIPRHCDHTQLGTQLGTTSGCQLLTRGPPGAKAIGHVMFSAVFASHRSLKLQQRRVY